MDAARSRLMRDALARLDFGVVREAINGGRTMAAIREITESDLNHVFSVERRGDTLILAPRGDATSFPEHHFNAAVTSLRRRLDGTQPGRVIFDLSDTDYPGLAVLDVIDDLVTGMHWRGETVVVAGASDDTLRVLNEYGLGKNWTHYADLDQAGAAIVHEPILRRIARYPGRIALVTVLLVVLLAGGSWWANRPHPDRVAFEEIMELWTSYRAARKTSVEVPDLVRGTRSLAEQIDEIVLELDGRDARDELIEPARTLQSMLHQPRLDDEADDRRMSRQMIIARDRIERDGY